VRSNWPRTSSRCFRNGRSAQIGDIRRRRGERVKSTHCRRCRSVPVTEEMRTGADIEREPIQSQPPQRRACRRLSGLLICPFSSLLHAPPRPSAPRSAADHYKHQCAANAAVVRRNFAPPGDRSLSRKPRAFTRRRMDRSRYSALCRIERHSRKDPEFNPDASVLLGEIGARFIGDNAEQIAHRQIGVDLVQPKIGQ